MSPPGLTSRQKLLATAAYCAGFAALGIIFSALGPTLPGLAENTRSTLSVISLLFVARGIGSIIGSIGGGRILTRFQGNRLVALAIFTSLAMAVLIPLATSLWALVAVIFVLGLSTGLLNVCGNTLMLWLHGAQVAPYMNLMHFSYGAGTSLAPLIVAQMLGQPNGMTWSYWLLALITVPAALFPLFVENPQPQYAQALDAPKKPSTSLAILLTLIFFGYAAASYAFGGWIFTYATRLGLADDATGAYLTSLYWGALTVGRLISIPLAVKLKPEYILRIDLVGALASVVVMMAFPTSLLAVIIGSAGLGFFLATIFPTSMSLAGRILPITGKETSFFAAGSSLGALIVPWLVGQYFESGGPHVLMLFLLIDIGLTLGAFGLLARKLNQRQSEG